MKFLLQGRQIDRVSVNFRRCQARAPPTSFPLPHALPCYSLGNWRHVGKKRILGESSVAVLQCCSVAREKEAQPTGHYPFYYLLPCDTHRTKPCSCSTTFVRSWKTTNGLHVCLSRVQDDAPNRSFSKSHHHMAGHFIWRKMAVGGPIAISLAPEQNLMPRLEAGRCTKTGGYLANAEINEIIIRGDGAQMFHDDNSNTDVMLCEGEYNQDCFRSSPRC